MKPSLNQGSLEKRKNAYMDDLLIIIKEKDHTVESLTRIIEELAEDIRKEHPAYTINAGKTGFYKIEKGN